MKDHKDTVLPKIYCFMSSMSDIGGIAYAIAEDGNVLGSHFCGGEWFVEQDLGVTKDTRPDKHETYKKHYPNGYEMVFVQMEDIEAHKGLQNAFKLNQELAKQAEQGDK